MIESNRRQGSALGAMMVAASLAAAALASACVPAAAQQSQAPQARIVVIGDGSVTLAPDLARIRSGVTTRAKTAKEAADANAKIMNAIVAALTDSGIEQKDIQTSRFSVQPIYTQQANAEAKFAGFSVSNQVGVTVRQIAKLGDILDRVVAAGATDVGSIEFVHSDQAKALNEAREAAIADARRKAQAYAQAAGLTLSRVVFITEDSSATPPLPFLAKGAGRAIAAAPPPIMPGEDTLHVQVTVGFDIAP